MGIEREGKASDIIDLLLPDYEILPYGETAEVTKEMPDLEITLRDLPYKKEKIKIDDYYIAGHEREIEIPSTTLTGSDSMGDAHISGGFPKAKIIFRDELKIGDKVAVLQSKDKQTLYVLFKVKEW